MLNSCDLVGKIVGLPIVVLDKNKNDEYLMEVEVERPFKNAEGIYDVDHFKVLLWTGIALEIKDLCKLNDYVTIKGRLQEFEYYQDNELIKETVVVGELINFITNRVLLEHNN